MHEFAESDGKTICKECFLGPDGCCNRHPHLTSVSTYEFLMMVEEEVFRARMLYPTNEGVITATVEEVGEVARAQMQEPRSRVIKEAVQGCAMLLRWALEGDPTLAELRQKRGLDR